MTKKIVCGLECYFDPFNGAIEVWIGNHEYLGTAADEVIAESMVLEFLTKEKSSARYNSMSNDTEV